METSGGLKGWMRKQDLQAVEQARGLKARLPDQNVTGGGTPIISPIIFRDPLVAWELPSPDRSFMQEFAEAIDKEQVEIRHGDN